MKEPYRNITTIDLSAIPAPVNRNKAHSKQESIRLLGTDPVKIFTYSFSHPEVPTLIHALSLVIKSHTKNKTFKISLGSVRTIYGSILVLLTLLLKMSTPRALTQSKQAQLP